ncbi:MAG TPA: hypothetical protein VHY20_12185 [Pirellulales bacterium]|nr:hypothetical protein [Pirellulales bacterium]
MLGSLAGLAGSEEATPEQQSAAKASSSEKLALNQIDVAAKFAALERKLLSMATQSAVSDPKRAALLRKAVAQSKEKLIALQMRRLADELQQDKLAAAVTDQQAVEEDLQKLLELLLTEQRSDRLKDERERVKAQLRKIKELINKQIELQAKTSGASKPAELAPVQGKLAEDADRLAKEMQPSPGAKSDSKSPTQGEADKQKAADKKPDNKKADEKSDSKSPQKPSDEKDGKPPADKPSNSDTPGKPADAKGSNAKPSDAKPSSKKPSQGQPKSGDPSEQPPGEQAEAGSGDEPPAEADTPGRKRVAAAQQKMESAQKKLEKAERDGAEKDQEEAVRELDKARAELEEILRQLRDEEVERVLAQLETRFRVMRQMQQEVYEGTKRVDSVPQEKRTRNDEIEAGRLSRKESMIVVEADKALIVLREEGTAVAMPEAVEQMRDDMNQVVARLGQAKVDGVTQGIEEEILAGLDEMIASLQQAQRDKQEGKQRQGQPGEPQDPPLVDRLAELKMLRSLQMRVNMRTQRYSKLIGSDTGESDAPELLDALQRLAEREERIYRATRDIVLGKNQ